jgi:hypothetical protein
MHLNVILQWLLLHVNPYMKKNERGYNKRIIGYDLRYYYSSIGNNPFFEYPVEIHDRKTLNKFIQDSVIDISNSKPALKVEDSEWKFHSYLHDEIVVLQTNLTIGIWKCCIFTRTFLL